MIRIPLKVLSRMKGLTLEVPVPLLERLNAHDIPYAHCAWCKAQFRVLGQLESHYFSHHNVMLQPIGLSDDYGDGAAASEIQF